MAHGRPWTPEEDRLLREACAASRREGRRRGRENQLRRLAERLGRTYATVRWRASHLGERSLDPGWAARRAMQRAQDRRTERGKALALAGTPRRHTRPWTPEEDATLAVRGGDGAGALADRLGRSRGSVEKRASRLGTSLRR